MSTTHVLDNGRLVDPSTDKDLTHWNVTNDPPPDVDLVFFQNTVIQYFSYDPPKGFTPEEIMRFNGAAGCLTLDKVRGLIRRRDQHGTLDRRGDDRWKI